MGETRFTVKIKLGNDAMTTRGEIASALRDVVEELESHEECCGKSSGPVMDINGNKVGAWEIK